MEIARLVFYGTGLLCSVAVVGQLVRIRHPLARMLTVMMVIWAVSCVVLMTNLALRLAGEPSHQWMFTVNALLMALGPLGLFLLFLRQDGRAR